MQCCRQSLYEEAGDMEIYRKNKWRGVAAGLVVGAHCSTACRVLDRPRATREARQSLESTRLRETKPGFRPASPCSQPSHSPSLGFSVRRGAGGLVALPGLAPEWALCVTPVLQAASFCWVCLEPLSVL